MDQNWVACKVQHEAMNHLKIFLKKASQAGKIYEERRNYLGNYFPYIAWEEKSLVPQGNIIRG